MFSLEIAGINTNFCIQHIAGNTNTADSLSRLPSMQDDLSDTGFVCENYVRVFTHQTCQIFQAVTVSDIRSENSKDFSLSKLLIQIQSGKWSHDLKPYGRVKEELSILEGVVLRGNRIVVPQSLQKQILTDLVEQEVGTETKESNDSTESGATASDACDNTKPSGHVDKQATQNEDVVTTKSGP